jgi:hypothetical protein|tara:strand:- start:480 stop:977 length:498 start_codon:yes stop_codon:yes gene_type:complete
MSWEEFVAKAKIIEAEFTEHLEDVTKSTKEQDLFEHWDVEGTLQGTRMKVDIKDMKKFNRKDPETQDEMACVEYVGVKGYPGWVQGKADSIAFKRSKYKWLVVNRQELWDMLKAKLEERSYSPSEGPWYEKEPYATYDRSFFGKQDKFCWVPFEDIEKLTHIKIQ